MTEPASPVDLKEHLELLVSKVEQRVELEGRAAREAIVLAKSIADGQREASNYVRDQLREQATKFPTREYVDARLDDADRVRDRHSDRFVSLETRMSHIEGKVLSFVAIGGIVIVIAASLVQIALREMGK